MALGTLIVVYELGLIASGNFLNRTEVDGRVEMLRQGFTKFSLAAVLMSLAMVLFAGATEASAQLPLPELGRIADAVNVQIKVGEITLESIDFRNQTANLNIGLDIANGLLPVSLKDFDYRLRLADRDLIEGSHDGALRIGGRRASRVNLPVTVHLRSIPGVVWSAFTNRGRLRYDLDSAFTLPLFITERRFDQSFSGEVPLRTLVDAASIVRARRLGEGGSRGGSIWNALPW